VEENSCTIYTEESGVYSGESRSPQIGVLDTLLETHCMRDDNAGSGEIPAVMVKYFVKTLFTLQFSAAIKAASPAPAGARKNASVIIINLSSTVDGF
jgi:hypothetical protein